MKKKLILLIACILLTTGYSYAKSLVLTLKNGTLVYYLLGGETNPMLKFVDGHMTLNDDKYEFSNIKNFYISETDDPNAIESVLTEKKISYSANTLVINTAKTNKIKVFTAGGTEVKAEVNQSGDISTVNLNNLPTGAYVINTGSTTFKVMKK